MLRIACVLAMVTTADSFSLLAAAGRPLLQRGALQPSATAIFMSDDDGAPDEQVALFADAAAKRKRAQELAEKAARAALEAEVETLKAQQLALEVRLANPEEMEELPAPPVVVEVTTGEAPAMSSTAATTALGDTTQAEPTTTSGISEEDYSELTSLLNVSSWPPPPPLTYGSIASVVEQSGKKEAALQLSDAQITACKERVFDPLAGFYVTKVDQTFLGTIFRGNLKKNASEVVATVTASADKESLLSGVTFLLLDDPMAMTLQDMEAGNERRPVFLVLPAEVGSLKRGLPELGLSVLALFISVVTTLGFALSTYLLTDGGGMLSQLENGDTTPIDQAAPIALALAGLQVLHEAAHYAAAKKTGIKTAVPVPVPSLQLGLFGCVTRIVEFPASRQALFEFALSGPLLAGVVSFILYLVGVGLSIGLPIPTIPSVDVTSALNGGDPKAIADATAAAAAAAKASGMPFVPVVPSGLVQSSLLLGAVATVALPALSTSPAVALHPLAVIGFVGTLINAVNLLPIGRLDGGRVAFAVLGQSTAGLVSGVCLLLIGLSTLVSPTGGDPILLFFGLFIIFFQRQQDLPCKDDITGVDDSSQALAAIAATFMLLTVLPYPVVPPTPDVLPPF